MAQSRSLPPETCSVALEKASYGKFNTPANQFKGKLWYCHKFSRYAIQSAWGTAVSHNNGAVAGLVAGLLLHGCLA